MNAAAQFNRKFTLTAGEVMSVNRNLVAFVSYVKGVLGEQFYISKMHSLLHTCLFVLRFGMFWNWSAKCFESALFPIKQMARDSKVNPMVSISNGMSSWISNHLHCHFFKHDFLRMRLPEVTALHFAHCNRKFLAITPNRRNERRTVKLRFDGKMLKVPSNNKRYNEKKEFVVTVDSYSEGKDTNNQFCLLRNQDKEEIVRKSCLKK